MLRFTIRDVLWLTVVVALIVVVWWADRATINPERASLRLAQEYVDAKGRKLESKMVQVVDALDKLSASQAFYALPS